MWRVTFSGLRTECILPSPMDLRLRFSDFGFLFVSWYGPEQILFPLIEGLVEKLPNLRDTKRGLSPFSCEYILPSPEVLRLQFSDFGFPFSSCMSWGIFCSRSWSGRLENSPTSGIRKEGILFSSWEYILPSPKDLRLRLSDFGFLFAPCACRSIFCSRSGSGRLENLPTAGIREEAFSFHPGSTASLSHGTLTSVFRRHLLGPLYIAVHRPIKTGIHRHRGVKTAV